MTASILSQARLKELLHYDPETGIFTWLVSRGRGRVGYPADHINTNGYMKVKIDGISYAQHRLAFLYMNGALPPDEVDHINHNRSDNRWVNLRSTDKSGNQRNSSIRKDNSSGHVGVMWYPNRKMWVATINANGKRKCLGYHETKEIACAVRKAAEIKYGYHENHGV